MKKSFNKGDEVTILTDWDGKGTVAYRHCVVYSCGLKRLVLLDAETGECIGRDFTPKKAESLSDLLLEYQSIFSRLSGDEVRGLAIPCAEAILVEEKNHIEFRLEDSPNENCRLRQLKELEALHEPRVHNLTGRRAFGCV
jgi:hypothetical protein